MNPRCDACGQFVRKLRTDGAGQAVYAWHVVWDDYNGGWEYTC
jgi:hypothetical protein